MSGAAIIVPTRNSAATLAACLDSIRRQTLRPIIVVVDNHSTDDTRSIAEAFADVVLTLGPERSAQRNAGAAAVEARVLGFIDSDMVLEPRVVEDAIAAIDNGAVAVTVPERTFGEGFWTRVRGFERSFYESEESCAVEAARFFSRDTFERAGGYDTELTGPEDWDLSVRVQRFGPVARTASWIEHNESGATFRGLLRKRAYYARGYGRFVSKHGWHALRVGADRPYLRKPWRLIAPHPLLGAGTLALKGGEAGVVAVVLARQRLLHPKRDQRAAP